MDSSQFQELVSTTSHAFDALLDDNQRTYLLDALLSRCPPRQKLHVHQHLQKMLAIDFLAFLPTEIAHQIVSWLDSDALFSCLMVSKTWNQVVSNCNMVWKGMCYDIGLNMEEAEEYFRGKQDSAKIHQVVDCNSVKSLAWMQLAQIAYRRKKEAFLDSPELSLFDHGYMFIRLYPYWRHICFRDPRLVMLGKNGLIYILNLSLKNTESMLQLQTTTTMFCQGFYVDEKVHNIFIAYSDCSINMWTIKNDPKNCHSTGHNPDTSENPPELHTFKQSFIGHTACVYSMAYIDEWNLFVSGSADKTVKLWEATTGHLLHTLKGHDHWVLEVLLRKSEVGSHVHSKGDYILISKDKELIVKLWILKRGEGGLIAVSSMVTTCRPFPHKNTLLIKWLPCLYSDGYCYITFSESAICVWSLENFKIIEKIPYPEQMKSGQANLISMGKVFLFLETRQGSVMVFNRRNRTILNLALLVDVSNICLGDQSWLDGLRLKGCHQYYLVTTTLSQDNILMFKWKQDDWLSKLENNI